MEGARGPGRAVPAILVVAVLALAGCIGEDGGDLLGKPGPNFTALDVDGQPHNLTDYRGRVLVIEFFATWCGYCSEQLGELKELRAMFNATEVAILHIDSDDRESEAKVLEYSTNRGIGWPVIAKGEKIAGRYKVDAIPVTVIIDQEGVVRHYHTGVEDASDLRREIEGLL